MNTYQEDMEIIVRLIKAHGVTETARRTGISRQTLHSIIKNPEYSVSHKLWLLLYNELTK